MQKTFNGITEAVDNALGGNDSFRRKALSPFYLYPDKTNGDRAKFAKNSRIAMFALNGAGIIASHSIFFKSSFSITPKDKIDKIDGVILTQNQLDKLNEDKLLAIGGGKYQEYYNYFKDYPEGLHLKTFDALTNDKSFASEIAALKVYDPTLGNAIEITINDQREKIFKSRLTDFKSVNEKYDPENFKSVTGYSDLKDGGYNQFLLGHYSGRDPNIDTFQKAVAYHNSRYKYNPIYESKDDVPVDMAVKRIDFKTGKFSELIKFNYNPFDLLTDKVGFGFLFAFQWLIAIASTCGIFTAHSAINRKSPAPAGQPLSVAVSSAQISPYDNLDPAILGASVMGRERRSSGPQAQYQLDASRARGGYPPQLILAPSAPLVSGPGGGAGFPPPPDYYINEAENQVGAGVGVGLNLAQSQSRNRGAGDPQMLPPLQAPRRASRRRVDDGAPPQQDPSLMSLDQTEFPPPSLQPHSADGNVGGLREQPPTDGSVLYADDSLHPLPPPPSNPPAAPIAIPPDLIHSQSAAAEIASSQAQFWGTDMSQAGHPRDPIDRAGGGWGDGKVQERAILRKDRLDRRRSGPAEFPSVQAMGSWAGGPALFPGAEPQQGNYGSEGEMLGGGAGDRPQRALGTLSRAGQGEDWGRGAEGLPGGSEIRPVIQREESAHPHGLPLVATFSAVPPGASPGYPTRRKLQRPATVVRAPGSGTGAGAPGF
jgi:hypothetical protein